MSKKPATAHPLTKPARISISYAAMVALITEAVLFVQDVFVHRIWTERDTLFVIAVAVGFITLVGPFLPVPVSFDTQDTPATEASFTLVPQLSPLAPVPTEPPTVGAVTDHETGNPWLPGKSG